MSSLSLILNKLSSRQKLLSINQINTLKLKYRVLAFQYIWLRQVFIMSPLVYYNRITYTNVKKKIVEMLKFFQCQDDFLMDRGLVFLH